MASESRRAHPLVAGNGGEAPAAAPTRLFLLHANRIIDMVNAWTAATDQPFISFEYFPPKTADGVEKARAVPPASPPLCSPRPAAARRR